MDKYIGKRFDGRYEIRELIGVGGMAYVYKAYDTIDDRTVAVKILKEEFLSNEEFTRRFKNESKAIAILSHPNIVKVFDVSFSSNLQYIVMEFIDGITLKEYLKGQKEMNWKETVHFVTQILRALQHAHDKGIVHRDVKPQNIMLLSDGTIKMTDFGIARFSRSDIRFTQSPEKAIGSVHYISPEQARGDITDEKADIYSVGVMMYEMLTKTLPFDGDNAVSVAIMQMQSEPKKPSLVNPDIPEGLEEITLKAMQKDPEKRYQSAAEMLYDIDEFKRNPSIHFAYKYFVDDAPTKFVDTIPIIVDTDIDDEDVEEVRKGPAVIPILAAITAALVIVAVVFLIIIFVFDVFGGSKVEEVVVANFVGKNYEEIIKNPDYTSVYTFTKTDKPSSSVDEGVVMRQSENAGIRLKKNPKISITLDVSSGPEKIEVPSITESDTKETAGSMLKDFYLEPKFVNRSSTVVPVGKVIEIDPKSGTKVSKHSVVTVYISTGEEVDLVKVPKVEGFHYAVAHNKLKADRLGYSELIYKNNEFGKATDVGTIIKQNPATGAMVEADTKVELTASNGLTNVRIEVPVPINATEPIDLVVYVNSTTASNKELSIENITYSSHQKHVIEIKDFDSDKYDVYIRIRERNSSSNALKDYIRYKVDGKQGTSTVDEDFPFVPSTPGATEPPIGKVEVPAFYIYDSYDTIKARLERAGLVVPAPVMKYHDTVPRNSIIGLSASGTVAEGTTVYVYVSRGPEE